MGVFVKLSSVYYSVGELVFYRSVIGVILMSGAARFQRGSLLTKYPKEHVIRSLCGAVALSLWFYSIGQLPLAMAMALNYTAPVWMVLFVIVITKLKGNQAIHAFLPMTIMVSFGGIVLMLQPTLQDNQWIGACVGLLSGFMSAIAFLQVAALGKVGEPGYRVVFYFSLVGVMLGLAMSIESGGFTPHTAKGILLLMVMGLFAAGAQWALTYAFSNGSALVNANLQYLTIAFSSVFGLLFFGDRISGIGMALIVASGVMATYVQNKQRAADPSQG
jgi:S-adenosylmethionine uptake transporter